MSWKERLDNVEFKITTGDGRTYSPLWKNGEKSKEFNITKYDFIELEGSLIERKKSQSNSIPLIFWFQGDDNIDQANSFENSANDERLWTVQHPFYGNIKGQPVSIKRDDRKYNVTEISVSFWESLDGNFPLESTSILNEVTFKADEVISTASAMFIENSNPSVTDLNNVKNLLFSSSSEFNSDSESFNDFINSQSAASKAIDSIVSDKLTAIESIQSVIKAPSLFKTPLITRINSYISAYNVSKETISNLFSKYNFEAQSATVISSICLACVNPIEGDYITRTDIYSINDLLVNLYNDMLETIDSLQVSIYDVEESWSPDVQIQSALANLVFFTSKSLFTFTFDAKQERIFELDKDSNVILLTHRFMGLDSEDKNINIFREINEIKNDEIFKIPKGRTVKYFV